MVRRERDAGGGRGSGLSRTTVLAPRFIARAAALALGALRERRLTLSPRRWLIDLRHLRGVMAEERLPLRTVAAVTLPRNTLQSALVQTATSELRAFLDGTARFRLPKPTTPVVSVVLVLFNRAELTLRCIRSLSGCAVPMELVLVDNGSTDATAALLDRIDNATIIRHDTNTGFTSGVNAGARAARGKYLLLLNNDAELLPGSLDAALRTAGSSPDIGLVGGRLIFPDGRLQEAASIIWRNGIAEGYGRGADPFEPEYSFRREADYCSGAFLLTPRDLFVELGGFDTAFDPAYYEDTDYCVRVWAAGKRVIYEPAAVVIHHEFGSSPSSRAARLQREKRELFVAKHVSWLAGQPQPSASRLVAARARTRMRRRILVFDDRVPHRWMGFGFPRAVELLNGLVELGCMVTLYPLSFPSEQWSSVYEDISAEIEVMIDHGAARLVPFMASRRGYYDSILVSRRHNLERLRGRLGDIPRWGGRVVYDPEALSGLREAGRQTASGGSYGSRRVEQVIAEEAHVARSVDTVIAVSNEEQRIFAEAGFDHVVIVRHAVEPTPTVRPFEERNGVLFVGAFDPLSPNEDAVLWFARDVRPRLDALLGQRTPLTVVGRHAPERILALGDQSTHVVDGAADLSPFYDACRVFIAPTRFSAGIPLKVIHAAAHGLPVVSTSLLARQLGWTAGVDLLVADSPEQFAAACATAYSDERVWQDVRRKALERIEIEYSRVVLRNSLARAFRMRLAAEE